MIHRTANVACDRPSCRAVGPPASDELAAEVAARKAGWRVEAVDFYGNSMHLCPICKVRDGLWERLLQGGLS